MVILFLLGGGSVKVDLLYIRWKEILCVIEEGVVHNAQTLKTEISLLVGFVSFKGSRLSRKTEKN